MNSAQIVVSLDATVFSATKNSENAEPGDKIVPGQADVLDETENPDITYCPKGKGNNPSSTKGTTARDSSRTKTTTSQPSNSSHRSAATPSRYPSGFVTGASNPTKSSQSSKDNRKK